jgi:hypothetical protein
MLIFINDGKYFYRYDNFEVIAKKQKTIVTIEIINKSENKCYSIEINETDFVNDEYFQSIKTDYEVLQLFGLSNIELFMILIDNSMKKNKYHIEWFKITPLNIRNDTIKFIMTVSSKIELLFTLNFTNYL